MNKKNSSSSLSHHHHHLSNDSMFFRKRKREGVMAADINRMSWLVDSGLSSFVTATTDGSVYAQKTIRDGVVAIARH